MNKAQAFKVGLFILGGLILLGVAIIMIGSRENLFTPTFTLRSEFQKVSGLKQGSVVRFNGIAVGKVDNIEIKKTGSLEVIMTIEERVQEFIKRDSKASIVSEGLVGNKIVEIIDGTVDTEPVQSGESIASIMPVDTEDIFRNLKESSEAANDITKNISEITYKINNGEGTLGKILSDDRMASNLDLMSLNLASSSKNLNTFSLKLNGTADYVAGDLAILSGNLRKIALDIEQVIAKLHNGDGIAGTLLTDTTAGNNIKQFISNLNKSSINIEDGTYGFAQNMEALKHNFLFKGYYEDIGYWDTKKKQSDLEKREMELRIKEKELQEREMLLNQNSKLDMK